MGFLFLQGIFAGLYTSRPYRNYRYWGYMHQIRHKISLLFIKVDNPMLLIVITGIIGGVVAGFGSLTGKLSRKLFTS